MIDDGPARTSGGHIRFGTVPIYLDNNATTRPLEPVQAAVMEGVREFWQNPSSIHRPGQAARQRVDLARKSLAALIRAKPRHLTLCGSGTEAIDLAIRGVLLAQGRLGAKRTREPGVIITTKAEHVAVRGLCAALEKEEGVRTLWAEFDAQGVVTVESVRALLDAHSDVTLVSIQWANNETGAVNPAEQIGALCRERGVVFHTDATQWVGKRDVDLSHEGAAPSLCCDLLTFSAHKFHGPKGVGALWTRPGVAIRPLIHGEQELGRRGGTENVPGILGAGVAAELAREWLGDAGNPARVAALRDRFEARVMAGVPGAVVNGPRDQRRLWNTTNIGFPRLEAEALLLLLSERGVCASAGAACSSGALEPSPVLLAMGVAPEVAHGSLRFSLSRETTEAEVEEAAGVVVECVGRLRESMRDMAT